MPLPDPATRQLLAQAQHLWAPQPGAKPAAPPVTYNLFAVLGLREQETKHTALLADLLDPGGAHGLGDSFLTCFLRLAGVPAAATSWRVRSEEMHAHGRWDVALHGQLAGRPLLVVVENKINAAESPRQLARYLRAAREHPNGYAPADTWLIFLTPDGRAARSCRQPDEACLLSWSYHAQVRTWLTQCLPQAQNNVHLYCALLQYLDLLTVYHDRHMHQTRTQQLAQYLLTHDLLAEAGAVAEALIQARAEVQLLFWQDLEQALRRLRLPLVLDAELSVSRELVTAYYRKKSRPPGYGLALKLLERTPGPRQLLLWVDLDKTLRLSVCAYYKHELLDVTRFRKAKFGVEQLAGFERALDWQVAEGAADTLLLQRDVAACDLNFHLPDLADLQYLARPAERQALARRVAKEVQQVFNRFPAA